MKRHLRRHVEMERLFGADFLPISRKRDKRASLVCRATNEPVSNVASGKSKFNTFRKKVLGCVKCDLCKTRTQVVFGVGPLDAPLMFIGEAPGADEDRTGEPFVGRAGQLLTRTLQQIGVPRERVYIANILKCRPPGNRTPQPDEMAACMPWLKQQVDFIGPKILCAMGNVAVQTLLNTKTGITQLRGRMSEALGVKLFPTFHPAYILRNMRELERFRADLKAACREAGLI